ncbi:phospholipase A2 [Rhizodiscina lignyota]|uniref:Phospholipase A2 n=1 Tax=Rhizodiscina lignyota TaxID=1504668 RepID=A0A9P4IN08_9PEZI|nr:phospholipase A2 [Rhizodiscina lignyota]
MKDNNSSAEVPCSLHNSIKDLITTYHELNSPTIEELDEEPSPLEFMRFVSCNRPFVVRKGAKDWPACRKWNVEYLHHVMEGQLVNVAITPFGNADSPLELDDGRVVFVKPYEVDEDFATVVRHIQEKELRTDYKGPVRYAQTQNDNLRNEYETLFSDVPKDIPFARVALERNPDAINFWLGNSHSTTALHKDNYENIYVQVLGQKHFVLLPPTEAACINERELPASTYATDSDEDHYNDLIVRIDSPSTAVPFATWDPDDPSKGQTDFSQYSRPMRVTLNEGDMLYLPALWYHKVSQSCSEEGVCCAVNYWYDMEFSGAFWSFASFTRSVGLLANVRDVKEKAVKEGVA